MDSTRLPCGTQVDGLLTQVTDRVPPGNATHQSACPHCRAALAELRDIWEPVDSLATANVRAPAGLLADVMARVRDLPRNVWYADLGTEGGDTRIAVRVISAIARQAAAEIPAVTLAFGAGRQVSGRSPVRAAGEDATDVGVAGSHVVVDVHIAVDMGVNIAALADRLRMLVRQRIADHTGLRTDEVNIIVVDVRPSQPGRGP